MKTNLVLFRTMTSCFSSQKSPGILHPGRIASHAMILALLVLPAVVNCGTVLASDPAGIYALVDKVVLEPAATAPERIQIWGLFSLAGPGGAGDHYLAPQPGYLYYGLKPGAKAVCEKEWADLKRVAGTHQCVAFASRYNEKGRVRKPDEKPSSPDEYPVAHGLTKVRDSNYPPVKKLLDAAEGSRTPANSNPVAKAPGKSD
jgi:hypothetical protein